MVLLRTAYRMGYLKATIGNSAGVIKTEGYISLTASYCSGSRNKLPSDVYYPCSLSTHVFIGTKKLNSVLINVSNKTSKWLDI